MLARFFPPLALPSSGSTVGSRNGPPSQPGFPSSRELALFDYSLTLTSALGAVNEASRMAGAPGVHPMELKERLAADLKDALRAGDETKRNTVRLTIAAIRNAE